MDSRLYHSKTFITVLIIAVLIFSFSVQDAHAEDRFVNIFIAVVIAVVILVVAWYIAPFVTPAISAITGLSIAAIETIGTIVTIATTANFVAAVSLCLAGENPPNITGPEGTFLEKCDPNEGEVPFAQFVSAGEPVLNVPAPVATNKENNIDCNKINLCFDLQNSIQYALYRDGNRIASDEVCRLPDGGVYSVCYEDKNLTTGQEYTYEMVVTNNIGQAFRYPAQKLTPVCK